MDRESRTLLSLFFLGIAVSGLAGAAAGGSWADPTGPFLTVFSTGLFVGMMLWLFAGAMLALADPEAPKEAGGFVGLMTVIFSGRRPEHADAARPRPARTDPSRPKRAAILSLGFGAAYLGLGLAVDAFPVPGLVAAAAVLAASGGFLLLGRLRARASVPGVAGARKAPRCERCSVACSHMPKFDAWYCPRCGTIYQTASA